MSTNLATFSDCETKDFRISDVSCNPRSVSNAVWLGWRIECRNTKCDLSAVTFVNCRFTDCYFGNARLNLSDTRFQDCKLTRVTFIYGQLANAVFQNTIIDDCRLRSAVLRGATFDNCRLIQSNIEKADLNGAHFVDTELEHMDIWGWHGFSGAVIPDKQKFKYFIARDVAPRLRQSIASGHASARLDGFIQELQTSGFGDGEVMLKFDEWANIISFDDFIAVGKIVAEPSP